MVVSPKLRFTLDIGNDGWKHLRFKCKQRPQSHRLGWNSVGSMLSLLKKDKIFFFITTPTPSIEKFTKHWIYFLRHSFSVLFQGERSKRKREENTADPLITLFRKVFVLHVKHRPSLFSYLLSRHCLAWKRDWKSRGVWASIHASCSSETKHVRKKVERVALDKVFLEKIFLKNQFLIIF